MLSILTQGLSGFGPVRQTLMNRCFATSSISKRWHREKVENRDIYRFGYFDPVKRSGPLPRLKNDSNLVKEIKMFRPTDPFSPSLALYGQNDYIDILGHEDLHPARVHYHIPKWLRGFQHHTHFQAVLRKNDHFGDTMEASFPNKYFFMQRKLRKYWVWQRTSLNQKRWTNYTGIKYGPVQNPYKTKYPF